MPMSSICAVKLEHVDTTKQRQNVIVTLRIAGKERFKNIRTFYVSI